MKADVEKQEDDSELGEQMNGASRRQQLGPDCGYRHSKDEIADDRADPNEPRKDRGNDPRAEQDQYGHDRICDFHQVSGLALPPQRGLEGANGSLDPYLPRDPLWLRPHTPPTVTFSEWRTCIVLPAGDHLANGAASHRNPQSGSPWKTNSSTTVP